MICAEMKINIYVLMFGAFYSREFCMNKSMLKVVIFDHNTNILFKEMHQILVSYEIIY